MLKFMEGFDQFNGQTDVAAAMQTADYVVTGTPKIVEGRKPTTRAVEFEGSVQRTFNTTEQLVVLGFAYNAPKARADIVTIKDVLTLGWTDSLSIGVTKGVAIPLVKLWYYYEIAIDKVNKEIRVYINNELDFTATLPASATFVQDYEVTWPAATGDAKQLDDLVFIDSSTGKYRDRVGPVQLALRLPTVDVVSEFSPASGSSHFPMVNKVPPDDANYIQSNVSGATDTFRSTDPVADGTLLAVGMVVRARKSDIDARQFSMVIGDPKGVKKEVLQPTMEITPTFSYAVFETDAAGADWKNDTMQTTPFGVTVRP